MWPKFYFDWLRKSAPTGSVEVYPEISETFETNLPNVFVIGDLTGVPLLKLACESGVNVWNSIPSRNNERFDVVIIGGGPAGISCALEGKRLGKKYLVLESNVPFQTIQSYPNGKPIFAEPKFYPTKSKLTIKDTTKELLLEDLNEYLKENPINIKTNKRVIQIIRDSIGYLLETESGEKFETNAIVIAIGKSGDPKKLGIPGESSSHVFYRLIDPKDTLGQSVVIIGGGDTALEAAIQCSDYAKEITLVHRGTDFQRAKIENVNQIKRLERDTKIKILYESQVTEIVPSAVFIKSKEKAVKSKAEMVFVLIGTLPPVGFLERVGIKLQNQKKFIDWLGFGALFSFATTAYFGKSAMYGPGWFSSLATFASAVSAICLIAYGVLYWKAGRIKGSFWKIVKSFYFIFVLSYFLFVYLSSTYFQFQFLGKTPAFHYTFLYSTTILIFGIRRILVRKTEYILYQTLTLIGIQVFFLFLLPEIILPKLGEFGLLGSEDSYIRREIFPGDAYWKAYGLILAWPLNMGVLYDGGITTFWLGYGLLFSFGLIPFLVYRYGKGAYCGWICSCGGLAETLGDEYRQKMPHSQTAYRIEHFGQYILFFAFILTLLKLVGVFGKSIIPILSLGEIFADSTKWIYDLVVDIGLAGVIGVGFYFLYSGRIWCRMFCPLASLMHIYARFSSFRIFSDKKKCISCNICTKNCHQGIDVMGYASRGIPMDSVQCVRCSACVSLCPTDVLRFGTERKGRISYDHLEAIKKES
ncbi:4Fe-4S binding protein [Leptospira yanagawae]|uniref:4Fe-4S binding protein n=1 Tax=Leptospira yanagawae TaxID=293069 RepID=A0ABY2M3K4_9LEPT|nr:NAD(P)-binding domain-containing protein [Leptospira yanagawae]TGL21774.1 4Fe-4S binding protein [Leptospira yanagawae]